MLPPLPYVQLRVSAQASLSGDAYCDPAALEWQACAVLHLHLHLHGQQEEEAVLPDCADGRDCTERQVGGGSGGIWVEPVTIISRTAWLQSIHRSSGSMRCVIELGKKTSWPDPRRARPSAKRAP